MQAQCTKIGIILLHVASWQLAIQTIELIKRSKHKVWNTYKCTR